MLASIPITFELGVIHSPRGEIIRCLDLLFNLSHETFPMIICEGLLGVYITVQILPKKARNIFSFKKSHLPALKVFLVIVLGIVHKESSYKDLQSHGMDLRGSSTIHKQISSFLRIPRKSMIKRFRECLFLVIFGSASQDTTLQSPK